MSMRLFYPNLRFLTRGALCLAVILIVATTATAQDEHPGAWVAFDLDLGTALRKSPYRDIKETDPLASSLAITAGMPLGKLPALHLGLGFNVTGYGHPDGLRFYGMHLDAKYKPFYTHRGYLIRHLQLSARANLPLSTSERTFNNIDYTTYAHITLALGWELPRLIGSFGLAPAIGVSAVSFGYSPKDSLGNTSWAKRSGVQTTAFLRLGIIFTKPSR